MLYVIFMYMLLICFLTLFIYFANDLLLAVCMSAKLLQSSDSLQPHGLQPAQLFCPWNFLGKNIGLGCHALLQGIFSTQGLNPCLLYLLH